MRPSRFVTPCPRIASYPDKATTIRGVALDTVRAERAARIASEHRIVAEVDRPGGEPEQQMAGAKPGQLRKALRVRLSGAILSDWRAAVGVMDGGHGRGNTNAKAHARRRRPRRRDGMTVMNEFNTPDARAGPTGAFFAERGGQSLRQRIHLPESYTIR